MTVEVEVLIHDHKKAISTIDGLEFHTVPGLLAQLRDAVFGGMESTGGSALGSKLPISAAALDLLTFVDREIAEAWAGAFKRPPNADRSERLLAEWAVFIASDAIVTVGDKQYNAEVLVDRWTQRIEDFFDPPRLSEIQANCFVCEARYIYTKVDGQDVRSSALRFHRNRQTGETLDARCMSCGTAWLPHEFEFLGKSIGIDVERKKAEHAEKEAQSG
jgi:hypothetical protein